ncbi:MAG: Rrf2 family transcriptional regulator [Desulfobacterota bacterium]|nr:Rrf2 family transcriptional regulator [Thermodesulfobacteriota bacterium]
MRLTTFSEYALIALMYMCRHRDAHAVPLSEIVAQRGLPAKYLERIMAQLCRAGILRSAKGKAGGYRLALQPDKITLAQIVRLFDGPLAPTPSASKFFYRETPLEQEKKILRVMKEIRDYIAERLESLTLQDML